jgi:hypothetical protein
MGKQGQINISTCHQLHELHRPEFTLWPGDTPPISMTPPFAIGINNARNVMSQRAKSTKTKEQPITNHSSVAPTFSNDEEDEETERAESAKTVTKATATPLSESYLSLIFVHTVLLVQIHRYAQLKKKQDLCNDAP